ncbi:hypothetical protein U1Q18_029082 [Sarracenia purpurea var. burkii]
MPVDAATFRRAMPLSCYDDYTDHIHRMADGVLGVDDDDDQVFLSVDPLFLELLIGIQVRFDKFSDFKMRISRSENTTSRPISNPFGFRGRSPPLPYILSSMLQTRAHPKLSTNQGIENGGSDIDLDDLKSQISKLSKEQKKAYFEEYDYRVKLLNKKQWREELKRMQEMKRKGQDAENEYGFMEEDADPENGSVAPVSTPLPDMVLPPSFDSDSPAYRYRFLEPTSVATARRRRGDDEAAARRRGGELWFATWDLGEHE